MTTLTDKELAQLRPFVQMMLNLGWWKDQTPISAYSNLVCRLETIRERNGRGD